MPARYYTKTFEDDGTTVKVVFLDTTPLIDKYRKKTDTYPDAVNQDTEAQLQWLEKTLTEATEDWIVVVGHHPIYAYTDKSESERTDMQKKVDTILRKHNVDMYICGHIHNYQHIRRPGSQKSTMWSTHPAPSHGLRKKSRAPYFATILPDSLS